MTLSWMTVPLLEMVYKLLTLRTEPEENTSGWVAKMHEYNAIIIDSDYKVRNLLARTLADRCYVVQVDCVEELGTREFGEAIVFVSDRDGEAAKLCRDLHAKGIFHPAIAYSEAPSLARVIDSVHGLFAGYIAWPCPEPELWNTFDVVTRSSADQVRRRIQQARARHKLAQLTRRERQVAEGIGGGFSSKELAKPLGISFRTVELHRANIMTKLGAGNMASMIRTVVEADAPADCEPDLVAVGSEDLTVR